MVPRGLIGVVHLPAMPGDPGAVAPFPEVMARALADATALARGGVEAIVVENFGSAPFVKGGPGQRLPPHQVAALALVVHEVRRAVSLPVGVNCLRNDARAAIGIAAATGAAFVRVNVHVGAYVTDQGIIEGEAATTLRYRQALGADVALLADVLVKHATPLAPIEPADATRDTLERGRADAVIVTGRATGRAVELALLEAIAEAAGASPVLVGSGLTAESAASVCPRCDGAIVGTALKEGGDVRAPVELARVRRLVEATRGRWR